MKSRAPKSDMDLLEVLIDYDSIKSEHVERKYFHYDRGYDRRYRDDRNFKDEAVKRENFSVKQEGKAVKSTRPPFIPTCFACGEKGHKSPECNKHMSEEKSLSAKFWCRLRGGDVYLM